MEAYISESKEQGSEYADALREQGSNYAEASREQGENYSDALEEYSQDYADWQENRQKAISGAETMIATIFDDYRSVFTGSSLERWGVLLANMAFLLGVILIFQKRKDVV
ncbi:MAG: hypothetical protein AB1345_14700 [Chloroflexota bacterium]